jgi:hypothetical protein
MCEYSFSMLCERISQLFGYCGRSSPTQNISLPDIYDIDVAIINDLVWANSLQIDKL